MKKWKQIEKYGKEAEVFEPQKEGKPWKVTLKCATFDEADAKRKLILEKSSKPGKEDTEVKVKRSNATGLFSVRVRVTEAPASKPVENVKEAGSEKQKKPNRRQQRDEKRGVKRQSKKEAAWKELKEKNESSPA